MTLPVNAFYYFSRDELKNKLLLQDLTYTDGRGNPTNQLQGESNASTDTNPNSYKAGSYGYDYNADSKLFIVNSKSN